MEKTHCLKKDTGLLALKVLELPEVSTECYFWNKIFVFVNSC